MYFWELASDKARCSADRGGPRASFFELACRLTQRLCAAGLADSAARSLAVAQGDLVFNGFDPGPAWKDLIRKTEECVAGTRKPKFVLENLGQAENAFRLGAIDADRYQRDLSRVAKTQGRLGADRANRLAILARTRFAPLLPADAKLKPSRSVDRIVPYPEPYEYDLASLTPDQQAEYLRAFRGANDLDLAARYARFRLGSVFHVGDLFPRPLRSGLACGRGGRPRANSTE